MAIAPPVAAASATFTRPCGCAAEPHAVAALHAVRRWSPAFASQAGDSWELARVACPELYSCAGFEGIARLAQKHGAAALRALERANCFGDGHKRGAYAWLLVREANLSARVALQAAWPAAGEPFRPGNAAQLHGLITEAVAHGSADEAWHVLRTLMLEPATAGRARNATNLYVYECLHGLGHGMLLGRVRPEAAPRVCPAHRRPFYAPTVLSRGARVSPTQLDGALAGCALGPTAQLGSECANGVFMSYGVWSGHGATVDVCARSRWAAQCYARVLDAQTRSDLGRRFGDAPALACGGGAALADRACIYGVTSLRFDMKTYLPAMSRPAQEDGAYDAYFRAEAAAAAAAEAAAAHAWPAVRVVADANACDEAAPCVAPRKCALGAAPRAACAAGGEIVRWCELFVAPSAAPRELTPSERVRWLSCVAGAASYHALGAATVRLDAAGGRPLRLATRVCSQLAAVAWQRNASLRLEAAALCVDTMGFDAVGTTQRWGEYARLFPPLLEA